MALRQQYRGTGSRHAQITRRNLIRDADDDDDNNNTDVQEQRPLTASSLSVSTSLNETTNVTAVIPSWVNTFFVLSFVCLLMIGLMCFWQRTFQTPVIYDAPGCADGRCYGNAPNGYAEDYYSTPYSFWFAPETEADLMARQQQQRQQYASLSAASSSSSSGTTVAGIVVIIILGILAYCTIGRGNATRDTGESAHRVYPPSSFVTAVFAPIVGASLVGASFFGLVGFLVFLFFGMIAAFIMSNYMSSAPEVAGGGAYVKS